MNAISLFGTFLSLLVLSVSETPCFAKRPGNDIFAEKRTYYEITGDVDLGGKTVVLPEDATIEFRGGKFRNGKVNCRNNTFLGKSGISGTVSLSGTVIGPLDLSVFELRRNDKSFDFGKVLNMAGSVCRNLIIPEGRFYLQTPVVLSNIRYYQQYGDLVYNGKSKDVTVFQFYEANAAVIRINGKIVYDTETKVIDYTRAKRTNIIGVEFVNINNSDVFIGDVEYFNNNIRISAYGAGNSYNKYTFNISVFSNEHLRIFQKDQPANQIGWCNENIFIGGRFTNWSHFDWNKCESVAIKIEGAERGDTYNGVNSLLFLKPCMEGFKDFAVYAKNVTGCHWQDARTEGCGKYIKFIGDCRYNEATSMYGAKTIDFTECATYPVKKDGLFPVWTTERSSSQLVLEVDTRVSKFYRVLFNNSDAKARVGIVYISDGNGRSISRSSQRGMIRPRSTNHPNSFYYNTDSFRWMLASDSAVSEFIIPDNVSRAQIILSGQYSGAVIYSDHTMQIIEK